MNETVMELDQAAFQRVWERVMPQDRPDCPFTLAPPDDDLSPAPQPLIRSPLLPQPLQEMPQSVPCLGEASMGELPRLEELAGEWAEARHTYRALARRMGSRGIFSTLAAEKDRQLRRLLAAYFLISGREYVPSVPGAPTLPKTRALALREGFRGEQKRAVVLMDAAQLTADPCLAQMYRALAEENREHADRLRAALERGQAPALRS